MIGVGLLTAAFIARRLWRSYRRLDGGSSAKDNKANIRTPLHALEKPAARHLGERAPGLTYAAWLAGLKHLLPDASLLEQAIAMHQRMRYDPQPVEPDLERQLAALANQLAHAIGR
jgi:hypothetical protein